MKKIFKYLSTLICTSLCFICILSSFISKDTNIQTPTRDVELNEVNVDYESEFSKYEDAKLEYSKDDGYVSFSGIINYSSNDLSDIDLASITNDNQDRLSIKYSFDYEIEENLFYMNVEAINTDNGTIFDRIVGVPFENENGEIDIIFDVEGEYIYLSELTDNMLLENCVWFSKMLKKVAKVAAVVAVAAVVVTACAYAAPAVIAVASGSFAATAAGTTVFIAGAAATSTLATCAAFASAAATTALVAGSIAATACIAITSNDLLTKFNHTLMSSQAWSLSEIQMALANAIKVSDRKSSNTVVYLGRDPEYAEVALSDVINNVVYFHLDDWMFYENKHGKEGMWLLNYAFMNYVILKEQNNNWQIRLTTDYSSYLTIRNSNQGGYFYSKEIDFLKNTMHSFALTKTYDSFGSYYKVFKE